MIDLHIHSNHSDGQCSVKQILEMAEQLKLSHISITDHEFISAYDELASLDVAKLYGGKIITGVELSTNYNGHLIHVLGYGFDVAKLSKSNLVSRENFDKNFYAKLLTQYKKIAKKLNLKFNDNLTRTHFAPDHTLYFEMIKYPENKPIFENFGIVHKGHYYWDHIRNPKSPFYVDLLKYIPTFAEVAGAIRDAGGLLVLAHPDKAIAEQFAQSGDFDGFECMHRTFTKEYSDYLVKLCKKNKLLVTGGSDYHGYPVEKLGYVFYGEGQVSENFAKDFLSRVGGDK